MKRNHTTKLVVAMSFLVLLVAATNSVVANPPLTGECGVGSGCHETFGTLTLTTNSTVDAETNVPFVLEIDAGNGAEYVAIKGGWGDNDFFTVSEPLVQDDSTNDTNAADGEISVEITITPLTNGTYTLRIWTVGEAGSDLADSFDVTVTVTGETGTVTPPPTTVNLYDIWTTMMIWVPVATAIILAIFGYLAIKRR
ncbi:MAG: hypothetical protein ACXAC0_02235 [Candidatus Thorarchaeota archaeon]|jgi:hypothetical protein